MAKRIRKSRKVRRGNAAATKSLLANPVPDQPLLASSDPEPVEPMPQPQAEPEAATAEPAVAALRLPALDDVDEAFFKQGDEIEAMLPQFSEDSIPPTSDDVKKESLPPPPEVLARRSKFRKFVGVVVVLCAFVVLGGLGRTIATEKPAAAAQAGSPSDAVSIVEAPVVPQPEKRVEPSEPEAKPGPSASAEESTKPTEVVAVAPEGVDPRKEALNLLNRGKMAEAILMARAAIQRDPNHALGYLYLGTALQESGKYKEAIATYGACVRNAKQGPVWECRAMGGRE